MRLRLKVRLQRIFISILYYSRLLEILNTFANKFELHKCVISTVPIPRIKRRQKGVLQILVYHRVNNDFDQFFPAMPIELFEQQMNYLCATYTIFPLREAVERLRTNDIPENAVAITFDDGYKDNFTNAFSILQRLRIPATIFLSAAAIDSGNIL